MAHFAELDSNNVVLRVIVVGDSDCLDSNGDESEAVGIAFCKSIFGATTNWAQTSYNGRIRGSYCGPGYTYDAAENKFYSPRPFASWTLNKSNGQWSAPVAKPNNNPDNVYRWDESSRSWVLE